MPTYKNIKNSNISLEKIEEGQEEFKSNIDVIARGNSKNRSKDLLNTITNIKNLYESRKKVIELCNDYANSMSEAKWKTNYGEGFKILTSKQILQRLPIAFAQVKVGNNSESLLNEIR